MDWPERARRARVTALAAAERLDVEAGTPIEVVRLDIEDARYMLVPMIEAGLVVGVVETDGEGRQVRRTGRLRSPNSFVPLAEVEARARIATVDLRQPSRVFLGWRPCRQSWDGFNPFWVIEFADGDRRYVDQAGHVHSALDPGGPGG
jgi:hypothetical protein